MYTKIINPITNKSVSINTLLGKNILRHYINFLNGGNKVKNLKLELNKCKKKRINLERKIKNLEKEITLFHGAYDMGIALETNCKSKPLLGGAKVADGVVDEEHVSGVGAAEKDAKETSDVSPGGEGTPELLDYPAPRPLVAMAFAPPSLVERKTALVDWESVHMADMGPILRDIQGISTFDGSISDAGGDEGE